MDAPNVVLCCASEDAASVDIVIGLLQNSGVVVDRAVGVELDTTVVQRSVDQWGSAPAYVICQTEYLGHFQIRRLMESMREAVGSRRFLTLQLDANDPHTFVRHLLPVAGVHRRGQTTVAPPPTEVSAQVLSVFPPSSPQPPAPVVVDDAVDPDLSFMGTKKKILWLGSGLAAVGLAAVAALAWPAATQATTETSPGVDADVTAAAASDAETANVAADVSNTAAAAVASPTTEPSNAAAADAAGSDAPPTEIALVDAEDEGTQDVAADPVAEPAPPPRMVDTPRHATPLAIQEALRTRKIRAVDAVLYYHAGGRALRYDQAKQTCDTLEVAGVAGWRLPELGEVRNLAEAGVLARRRVYWSSTAADAYGDGRLTYNVRRKRINPHNPRWRGGRAVCIQILGGTSLHD